MAIGERIKQARLSAGLSLRSLAQKAEVSAMAISKYETGKDMPGSDVLIRLSGVLAVPLDFFFRPAPPVLELQAYRRHAQLPAKEQKRLDVLVQDWLERYRALEDILSIRPEPLPAFPIERISQAEEAAVALRMAWNLGLDPIENLTQTLEDHGIKIMLLESSADFDACSYTAGDERVIVFRKSDDIPGDRQRLSIAHEMGHLLLRIDPALDAEDAAFRFGGAFIVPEEAVKKELGARRRDIGFAELDGLKHKYGLSMQAWLHRAADLGVITQSKHNTLRRIIREKGWKLVEPGEQIPPESPCRMRQLGMRALAEGLVTRSRAEELLQEAIVEPWQPAKDALITYDTPVLR
jgi:transcriptional regulator with XRE-family HTH domain